MLLKLYNHITVKKRGELKKVFYVFVINYDMCIDYFLITINNYNF